MAKMSVEKRTKLIYSVELIVIAIVFVVIAILEILRVMHFRDWVLIAFNWVTIFGGTWMIVDFVWTLVSKKKRTKSSLLDKCLLLPLGIYLITFDIICFTKQAQGLTLVDTYDFRMYMMTSAFFYIAAVYIFQGIYHYYHPIPMMVKAIQEAQEAELEKQKELEEKNKTPEETPEVIENKEEKPNQED